MYDVHYNKGYTVVNRKLQCKYKKWINNESA